MGKGSSLRKGANLKKYWESDYWKELDKRKIEALAKCVFCDKLIKDCNCEKKSK
jgi:hypothetical protein